MSAREGQLALEDPYEVLHRNAAHLAGCFDGIENAEMVEPVVLESYAALRKILPAPGPASTQDG